MYADVQIEVYKAVINTCIFSDVERHVGSVYNYMAVSGTISTTHEGDNICTGGAR